MTESITVQVFPLEELAGNTYQLKQLNPVDYPVKRLYNAIAKGDQAIL